MKYYTIIAGVNGVGKSSITGFIGEYEHNLGEIIDVDKITTSFDGNAYQAGKFVVKKIESCFERGISFTQETTLSGKSILNNIQKAISLDYQIRLYYVAVSSVEESLIRIRNRVKKGGHDIPEQDVRRRFEHRFENLIKVLPYCNQAFFYDNENGFVPVARYYNGQIFPMRSYRPAWLEELIKVWETKLF